MSERVALVTGGTRGIGLGIAQALAGAGCALALVGRRSASEVAAALNGLGAGGTPVHYITADISVAADRERLVDDTLARFGRIDILVNNAGRAPRVRADLLDATEDGFEEVLRTNLAGPYFLTQAVARSMIGLRGRDPSAHPSIVFVTSVSAEMASIHRGEYCVSKAGLAMAAQLLAVRLAPERIDVFDVRPGIIDTDMTAPVREMYDRRIADGLVPSGRWGTAADVGAVVRSLVTGNLPYATGSVIHVDGGLHLGRL